MDPYLCGRWVSGPKRYWDKIDGIEEVNATCECIGLDRMHAHLEAKLN